jgi:malate dehydrogenase (quinone)
MVLIEKYAEAGQVNSNSKNNSQTLHVGDIDTHYSMKKVAEVQPAAMMVPRYVATLPEAEQSSILTKMQRMVLGVGVEEVAILEKRYDDLLPFFPKLKKIHGKEIAEFEPEVMRGRNPNEKVIALYNEEGYTVDFGALSRSFIEQMKKEEDTVMLRFNEEVLEIVPEPAGYSLTTSRGTIRANCVVVDTDAYSLGFAKSLGYGKEFSLIPVAGSFYFSPKLLKGKVYTVQEPQLPFSAVHGDPDLSQRDKTRWGPTARFFPVLESGKLSTMMDYFASAGLGKLKTWESFFKILFEPIRGLYLLKNLCYEIPWIGKRMFVKYIQKIVPSVRAEDLEKAYGYGGMRLQRVNVNTQELLLGEGKIVGKNIIFNMTPSPGASVCLYNAMRDAEQVVQFLPQFSFNKEQMQKDLL